MIWLTAALLAAYVGACELRAPAPWAACESRWSVAIGVLVPSPINGTLPAIGRLLQRGRRREDERQP